MQFVSLATLLVPSFNSGIELKGPKGDSFLIFFSLSRFGITQKKLFMYIYVL